MATTLTVFSPILNAGTDLFPFAFDDGPRIDVGLPAELTDPLNAVVRSEWVSPYESQHFQVARGWLWVQCHEQPSDNPLQHFIQTNVLAAKLEACLACAHLAGCGENDYWRYGSQIEICCAYRVRQSIGGVEPMPPCRFNFRYGHPAKSDNTPQWTQTNLEAAGKLFSVVGQFDGRNLPRLWMAFRLWNVLCTLGPGQVFIRFQLAITALETFYIRPDEWKYIWQVQDRVAGVFKSENIAPPNEQFWKLLQELRNDITHRGGVELWTYSTLEERRALLSTDTLLRASICWAFKNQAFAQDAMENGRWPAA